MLGKLYLAGKEVPRDEEKAVYWLTQSTEQGNQYAKTQKALLDKLHQNIECYRDVELTEDSRMTLGQWLDRWLTEYKAGTVRPGTLEGYRRYIEYYIKPQLGDKQISLLSQQDIQRMYRRLKTEGRIHTTSPSVSSPVRSWTTSLQWWSRTRCGETSSKRS